jgi:EAL domain-containing protein (putative c-di-GMP-specific phosphodiesterase class I)
LPLRFIPLAEESDLICEIGTWVLGEALRQLAICRAQPGLENLTIAVNVSAIQLHDELLVQRVVRSLAEHGLPGSALCVELTESAMMNDPEAAIEALDALRRLGVKVSVDDFGTEYSSLAYLQRLPVDSLKIDRSFVTPLSRDDTSSESLVTAIVAMARGLKIETIAEGVETVEQAERLVELGADLAQGYLFARPVRAEKLLDVIGLISGVNAQLGSTSGLLAEIGAT